MFAQTYVFPKLHLILPLLIIKMYPVLCLQCSVLKKSEKYWYHSTHDHGKIGISLHMKVFEPHMREQYRLRAQEKRKK
jgi:hypothetical protein